MSNHEGPGCGCSSCLEMYPTPKPCENCKRLERELAEARAQRDECRESSAANLAALRAENKQLEAAVTQGARATRSMEKRLVEAETAYRAEVEAAARWCFVAGKAAGKTEADFRDGEDFFTAWSRYQQEKARREP